MRDEQSTGSSEIAALAQRVETARGKLPLQHDSALFEVMSEGEIAAERELAEWVRAQRRKQRRRAVEEELAAEKRDRQSSANIRRADEADARWHRRALAARRRVSSEDARLAQLYKRAEWSSRALIAVVVLGMVWAGVNVQHNLVPSGDMSDPLYWLSYGIEAMISIPIITIMVAATTAARWGRELARGKVIFFETALLGTTIALNAGPHLASGAYGRAAEYAIAPVMVGVVIWLHAWVSARYALLIDGAPVVDHEPVRRVNAERDARIGMTLDMSTNQWVLGRAEDDRFSPTYGDASRGMPPAGTRSDHDPGAAEQLEHADLPASNGHAVPSFSTNTTDLPHVPAFPRTVSEHAHPTTNGHAAHTFSDTTAHQLPGEPITTDNVASSGHAGRTFPRDLMHQSLGEPMTTDNVGTNGHSGSPLPGHLMHPLPGEPATSIEDAANGRAGQAFPDDISHRTNGHSPRTSQPSEDARATANGLADRSFPRDTAQQPSDEPATSDKNATNGYPGQSFSDSRAAASRNTAQQISGHSHTSQPTEDASAVTNGHAGRSFPPDTAQQPSDEPATSDKNATNGHPGQSFSDSRAAASGHTAHQTNGHSHTSQPTEDAHPTANGHAARFVPGEGRRLADELIAVESDQHTSNDPVSQPFSAANGHPLPITAHGTQHDGASSTNGHAVQPFPFDQPNGRTDRDDVQAPPSMAFVVDEASATPDARTARNGYNGGDRAATNGHNGHERTPTNGHNGDQRAATNGHNGADRAATNDHNGDERTPTNGHSGDQRAATNGHNGGDRAATSDHNGDERTAANGRTGEGRASVNGRWNNGVSGDGAPTNGNAANGRVLSTNGSAGPKNNTVQQFPLSEASRERQRTEPTAAADTPLGDEPQEPHPGDPIRKAAATIADTVAQAISGDTGSRPATARGKSPAASAGRISDAEIEQLVFDEVLAPPGPRPRLEPARPAEPVRVAAATRVVPEPPPVAELDDEDLDDEDDEDILDEDNEISAIAREIVRRRWSNLPVEQLAEILVLADESWPTPGIANEVGVSRAAVSRALEAAIKVRRP
ncbi:hypothetical protein, partial [Nocardia altamirensis]|uniref:hypothetical protein n=1 Tax=Nocardia altamirensis TaxID=472158 RepID=UPI000840655C